MNKNDIIKKRNAVHFKMIAATLAALVISALPMLFLYAEDMLLFKLPHERTYASESKTISGDSIYLARALKTEYEKKFNYSYDPGTIEYYTDNPYTVSQEQEIYGTDGYSFFMQQLETLIKREIIPQSSSEVIANMLTDKRTSKYTYSNTGDGFISFSAYYADDNGYQTTYIGAVTLETKTGKITSLQLYPEQPINISSFDAEKAVRNYIDYLDISIVDDWSSSQRGKSGQPDGYMSAELYSQNAHMMLNCEASDMHVNLGAQYMSDEQAEYWKIYLEQSAKQTDKP